MALKPLVDFGLENGGLYVVKLGVATRNTQLHIIFKFDIFAILNLAK